MIAVAFVLAVAAFFVYLTWKNRAPMRAIYKAHPEYTYQNLQAMQDEGDADDGLDEAA